MGVIINFIVNILFGRLLNVRPRIRKVQSMLIADTAPHIAILTLGLKMRRVMIDPQQKAIRIFARYAWLIPRVRHIPFDVVECVLYTYNELNNQFNPLSGWEAYQQQDMFVVGLRLKDGEEPILCRFYGQGDFMNNSIFPDWMYWEVEMPANMTHGTQEDESRGYASTVAGLIGVDVRNC